MAGKNKWTKKFGIFKRSAKYSIPVHPRSPDVGVTTAKQYIKDTRSGDGHYIRPPIDEAFEEEDEESE